MLTPQADQVAALYSLLNVEDRPASAAATGSRRSHKSAKDLRRDVRSCLPEDAWKRLEADLRSRGR